MFQHSELFYKKLDEYYSNENKKKPWNRTELKEVAAEILLAKQTAGKKTRRQYHLLSLYNILEVSDRPIVMKKHKNNKENNVSVVAYEDLYNIVYEAHINVGHGGRDKMIHELKTKYDVGRYAIEKLIETCEVCQKKKNKSHANLTIKPIISTNFNSRGQVDLIDLQSCPDNEYHWLLNYQDHLTKFLFLRPLKTKTAHEVAKELLKIFLEIGAPSILQSDNGREFTASVISEVATIWPSLKILHGRPRHPQSQGSIERSNQDVENMLRAWMYDHQAKNWSLGCFFVQFQKNSSYHKVIGRTPYKALFGVDPKVGFTAANIPRDLLDPIENEDDLINLLKEDGNETECVPEQFSSEVEIGILHETNAVNDDEQIGIEETMEVVDYQETSQEISTGVVVISNSDSKEINIEKLSDQMELDLCVTCLEDGGKCVLCQNKILIEKNRHDASRGQKRAAEKMLSNTVKKLPPLHIGSCILLPVDKIDRGPFDMQNILCVVTEYRNGVYQVGCLAGRIKSWYNRPDLMETKENFLQLDEIPEKLLSVRECVQSLSLTDGQGYFKCSCKPSKKQCLSNRCVCFKKKVLCNSRCHKSVTCANK